MRISGNRIKPSLKLGIILIPFAFQACFQEGELDSVTGKNELATSALEGCETLSLNNYLLPGAAKDIAANRYPTGTINHWVVGTNANGSGYRIYRWVNYWEDWGGGAVRIGVANNTPWVVNNLGYIYKLTTTWARIAAPFLASDIAGNKNSAVFAIGSGTVYKLIGSTWSAVGSLSNASRIAVDDMGTPFVTTTDGDVMKWNNTDWVRLSYAYGQDIAATGNGVLFITGASTVDGAGNYAISRIRVDANCIEQVQNISNGSVLGGTNLGAVSENEIWYTRANGQIYKARL